MSTVRELAPGDVVDQAGMIATFISSTAHPLYPGLRIVTWRMQDGSLSLDALSPFQYVGEARRTNEQLRQDALRRALQPGSSSTGLGTEESP
jgi:hypothetical protein